MTQTLPKLGETVRIILRDGNVFGEGKAPNVRWIRHGYLGEVVRFIAGFPRHRCMNHNNSPECECGGQPGHFAGMVPKEERSAVVEWHPDGGGAPVSRCIEANEEGKRWERISH